MKVQRKRIYLLFFICFHISIICLIVIRDGISSFRYLLLKNKFITSKDLQPISDNIFYKTSYIEPIYFYSVLSGIYASYSFFAPKVAKSTALECIHTRSKDSTIITTYYPPNIKTYEGIQRYSVSINNLYSDIMSISDSTERINYFNYITKSIGVKLLKEDRLPNDEVKISYSFFFYPNIKDLKRGIKPTMVNLSNIKL